MLAQTANSVTRERCSAPVAGVKDVNVANTGEVFLSNVGKCKDEEAKGNNEEAHSADIENDVYDVNEVFEVVRGRRLFMRER